MNSIQILQQTPLFAAISKPSGVASQSASSQVTSVEQWALDRYGISNYHFLSRLDQPVSGLMMIGMQSAFTHHYLNIQKLDRIIKTYYAIVEGVVKYSNKRLEHYHIKKGRKAILTNQETKKFNKIGLDVHTIQNFDRYSLVKIQIHSGKFHQIRAQLAADGHPIKGDVKYGARRGNPDRSIHLHAYSIEFIYDDVNYLIKAPIPKNDVLWQLSDKILLDQ